MPACPRGPAVTRSSTTLLRPPKVSGQKATPVPPAGADRTPSARTPSARTPAAHRASAHGGSEGAPASPGRPPNGGTIASSSAKWVNMMFPKPQLHIFRRTQGLLYPTVTLRLVGGGGRVSSSPTPPGRTCSGSEHRGVRPLRNRPLTCTPIAHHRPQGLPERPALRAKEAKALRLCVSPPGSPRRRAEAATRDGPSPGSDSLSKRRQL